MNINNIDLNAPSESLVMQAIFQGARSNEPRGWSNAFTPEELFVMYNSSEVQENWSLQNKDWLAITVGELLDKELNIKR